MSNGEGLDSMVSRLSSWNCCGFFWCFMTFGIIRVVEVGAVVADSEGSRRKRKEEEKQERKRIGRGEPEGLSKKWLRFDVPYDGKFSRLKIFTDAPLQCIRKKINFHGHWPCGWHTHTCAV